MGKITAIVLASVLGVAAAASKPQLSISVRDGQYAGLDALDPTVRWSNDAVVAGDIDLEYGVEASARPTADIASLPRTVWGRASKTNVSGGWGVSARAQVDAQTRDSADLQLDAANADLDLSVRLTASAGGNLNVETVQATKGFALSGGSSENNDKAAARVTVTPRMNWKTDHPDVQVRYAAGNTNVKLTASAQDQEVTVSQQVDDINRVAPTFNSRGDISVEWERTLNGNDDNSSSSLTANLKPDDSLNVKWKDADWTANVNMPMQGTNINGANVSIRRDVNF